MLVVVVFVVVFLCVVFFLGGVVCLVGVGYFSFWVFFGGCVGT